MKECTNNCVIICETMLFLDVHTHKRTERDNWKKASTCFTKKKWKTETAKPTLILRQCKQFITYISKCKRRASSFTKSANFFNYIKCKRQFHWPKAFFKTSTWKSANRLQAVCPSKEHFIACWGSCHWKQPTFIKREVFCDCAIPGTIDRHIQVYWQQYVW